ncbi:MAG TPA: hypothetical protein VFO35_17610, partial [Steroidobacteraceae bacterium]|nr:hypothetical protein [Steroidobacteraceae bacterium]
MLFQLRDALLQRGKPLFQRLAISPWRAWGFGHGVLLDALGSTFDGATEQMRIARLALAGLACQPHHERSV